MEVTKDMHAIEQMKKREKVKYTERAHMVTRKDKIANR